MHPIPKPLHLLDDAFILDKIRNPETRDYGFNLLVNAYKQRIYKTIRRMVIDHDDVDDLTQETFIKVHRNLDRFRSESALFTWIYRIATNECLGFLRSKRRRYLIPVHDVEHELAAKVSDGHLMDADDLQKQLQLAILRLPEKQRLVFQLRYFDEMPYEEIAAITGTTVGALKASHHHAVRKISNELTLDLND